MSVIRDGSPRSVKLSKTVHIAGVLSVDFAKVRILAAQANPLTQQRLEDSRTIGKAQNAPQPNVVSKIRRSQSFGPSHRQHLRRPSPVRWTEPAGDET